MTSEALNRFGPVARHPPRSDHGSSNDNVVITAANILAKYLYSTASLLRGRQSPVPRLFCEASVRKRNIAAFIWFVSRGQRVLMGSLPDAGPQDHFSLAERVGYANGYLLVIKIRSAIRTNG